MDLDSCYLIFFNKQTKHLNKLNFSDSIMLLVALRWTHNMQVFPEMTELSAIPPHYVSISSQIVNH